MEGEFNTTKIEKSQPSQHEFKEVVHEKIDDSPIKIETSQPSQHEFKEIEAEVVHEKVDDSPIKIETSQPSQHEFKEIEAEVVHEKVDDSPIKIETSQPSQHEFKEIEAEVVHEKVDDSPIKIETSQPSLHELKEIEAEVVHEKVEVDDSPIKIETSHSSQHEFKEIEAEVVHEKVDDSPIKIETSQPSQHEFKEIDAEVIHENKCLSLIPYEGSLFFNLVEKQGDNMAESKKDEMRDMNINYTRTSENDITISVHKELETRVAMLKALPSPERKRILGLTPRKISEASIKQTSSSSVNRFAKTHEKAFSQMPSIMTHYAAQKTKKAEEIQDEINRKRKDLGGMQPLIKKRKLANSTAKEVAKSSVRLGVTQHVLKTKTKEGVAKKPKPSLLPRRVSGIQKKMSK